MISSREFGKRLLALEEKGSEVTLIGRKDRLFDLRRKLELGRFLKRLILTHRGRQLVIALVDAPELQGDHVSLCLALKIPVGHKSTKLTKSDKVRLESFLELAIQKSSRSPAKSPVASRQDSRTTRRRASSGM